LDENSIEAFRKESEGFLTALMDIKYVLFQSNIPEVPRFLDSHIKHWEETYEINLKRTLYREIRNHLHRFSFEMRNLSHFMLKERSKVERVIDYMEKEILRAQSDLSLRISKESLKLLNQP